MIRIERGPEPPALAHQRSLALPALRAIRATRALHSRDFTWDYRTAFESLQRLSRGRCCYCEFPEGSHGTPVEHFRPKTQVDREDGAGPTEGYWWLAYTWENLGLSCPDCNGSRQKGIKFPLQPGSRPLSAEEAPPGGEQPLLIDPYSEDPGSWLEFVPVGDTWLPRPRRGAPEERGLATLRILRLHQRQRLVEERTDYLRHELEPTVRRIQSAAARGIPGALKTCWAEELSHRFAPGVRFQALAYDVFSHHFDGAFRAQHGLDLPRPLLTPSPAPMPPPAAPTPTAAI